MSKRIRRAWRALDRWIGANAPASSETLRPGADEASLEGASRALGFDVPQGLAASLGCHDGQVDARNEVFLEGHGLLPLDPGAPARPFAALPVGRGRRMHDPRLPRAATRRARASAE